MESETVGRAIARYRGSSEFWSKAQSTQFEYRRVAEHLELEIGHVPISAVNRPMVRDWKDAWAAQGHRAATIRLQVLKNALKPLMSDGVLSGGLFAGQQRVNPRHEHPEQNLAWTDEEVGFAIDLCMVSGAEGLARAIGLARYHGLRRQTICNLDNDARYAVIDENGERQHRLRYRVEKSGQTIDVSEDPRLTELLEMTSEFEGPVAYNKRYERWKPRQLNQALDRLIEKLHARGLSRPNLTLHGLRHSRGNELAYAGLSDAEIMAQLGHADEQSARVYRRQAQRNALAERGQRLVNLHRARRLQPSSGVLAPPMARRAAEEQVPPELKAAEAHVNAALARFGGRKRTDRR